MDSSPGERREHYEALRKHLWEYFHMHGSQRLTTVNYFVIISTVLGSGYLQVIHSKELSPFGIVIGLLIMLLSFVFWKLDMRIRDIMHGAESALRHVEKELADPGEDNSHPETLIFNFEKTQRAAIEARSRSWLPWRHYYSCSKCFNALFALIGGLGFLLALYCLLGIIG